jgi:hypothetical protein
MDSNYNNQINNITNYDNVFIRSCSLSVCRVWSKSIRWINRFEDGEKIRVLVPFYLSLVGDERFVLDAFVDDTLDKRIELNTDQIPRGIITFNGLNIKSGEFANPNQYLSQTVDINDEIRKIISKVKATPISITYNFEIKLATEIDADLCVQKIMDTYFNYQFFRFNYYGLNIVSYFKLPDDFQIEINREDSMTTESRYKKLTFSINVETYYPIFKVNSDDLEPCSNDGEIDWDFIGIPKPTDDFCNSIEEYYKAHGQKGYSCNFNRVFWNNYYYSLNDYPVDKPKKPDGKPDIDKWNKYNV